MKLHNNKVKFISFFFLIVFFSCKKPSNIGLDIHPNEDRIIINNNSSLFQLQINTVSEDSIRADEPVNLLLGNLTNDPIFPKSNAYFATNLMLTSNNISFGDISNIIVDSVVLSYVISDKYGENMQSFPNLYISKLKTPLYKDSIYYSNYEIVFDPTDLIPSNNIILEDTNALSVLKINLDKSIGEQIINLSGTGALSSNSEFLQYFYGLKVSTVDPTNLELASDNMILYLNSENQKSNFKIFYRDISASDTVLSFSLSLGGDAARINLFNQKSIDDLLVSEDSCYIQSMSGYKTKISISNLDKIRDSLANKIINKATLKFSCNSDFQYDPHQKLFLVRKTSNGENVFLSDYVFEGESHFGGFNSDNVFKFNITRYLSDLMQAESNFTNELYLIASGALINSNRTIIPKSSFELQILHSDL